MVRWSALLLMGALALVTAKPDNLPDSSTTISSSNSTSNSSSNSTSSSSSNSTTHSSHSSSNSTSHSSSSSTSHSSNSTSHSSFNSTSNSSFNSTSNSSSNSTSNTSSNSTSSSSSNSTSHSSSNSTSKVEPKSDGDFATPIKDNEAPLSNTLCSGNNPSSAALQKILLTANQTAVPPLRVGPKTFHLMPIRANWHRALYICHTLTMRLASINNAAEQSELTKHIESNGLAENDLAFWLSGTDLVAQGDFVWLESGQAMTYTNWSPSEPNNAGRDEHCVQLTSRKRNFGWNDFTCGSQLYFICEVSSSNC